MRYINASVTRNQSSDHGTALYGNISCLLFIKSLFQIIQLWFKNYDYILKLKLLKNSYFGSVSNQFLSIPCRNKIVFTYYVIVYIISRNAINLPNSARSDQWSSSSDRKPLSVLYNSVVVTLKIPCIYTCFEHLPGQRNVHQAIWKLFFTLRVDTRTKWCMGL